MSIAWGFLWKLDPFLWMCIIPKCPPWKTSKIGGLKNFHIMIKTLIYSPYFRTDRADLGEIDVSGNLNYEGSDHEIMFFLEKYHFFEKVKAQSSFVAVKCRYDYLHAHGLFHQLFRKEITIRWQFPRRQTFESCFSHFFRKTVQRAHRSCDTKNHHFCTISLKFGEIYEWIL